MEINPGGLGRLLSMMDFLEAVHFQDHLYMRLEYLRQKHGEMIIINLARAMSLIILPALTRLT